MKYCHSISNWVPVKKSIQNIFYKKSIRWNSSVPAMEIDAHVDWTAAKPFSEMPSLTMLPFVGTAWHHIPIIGLVFMLF